MSDLLPPNATDAERALSEAIDRNVPVRVREMWNPESCPNNLLAWLAWAFSVDEWSADWTDAQKREVIKRSIDVHRYKGTIGAVKEALAGLFISARVQEWFYQTPVGDPYTFRVLLEADQIGIDQVSVKSLLAIIDRTKNLRSHLERIETIVVTNAATSSAVVSSIGSEFALENYIYPPSVVSPTTVVV